jgi:hypothetical protein
MRGLPLAVLFDIPVDDVPVDVIPVDVPVCSLVVPGSPRTTAARLRPRGGVPQRRAGLASTDVLGASESDGVSDWNREQPIGGRRYANAYRSSGKRPLVDWMIAAVEASGCTVLGVSDHTISPVHIGIRLPDDRRLGATVYAFRSKDLGTGGRPPDEYEIQVRLMGEEVWASWPHPVGFDPQGVESTAVMGIQLTANVGVALDPRLYDPLPMGNSVQFRDAHAQAAQQAGWHVWERGNVPGTRREARAAEGFETCIAFWPDRFVDLLLFEREALDLRLDQSLRFHAAVRAGQVTATDLRHQLEIDFDLRRGEIFTVLSGRRRLTTAVRGGVAELHLGRTLERVEGAEVAAIDRDGQPDFEVQVGSETLRVECKNVLSTKVDAASGLPIVELWKTRGKIPGRLYDRDHFDVVAACLWPQTKRWEFRYKRTRDMPAYPDHPDKLFNFHTVDDTWSEEFPPS